jgi:membrane associated rhomboid family serine protease
MIPIRDTIPSRTRPVVNISLIVINALVFLYEVSAGAYVRRVFQVYGLIPSKYFYLADVASADFIERFYPFLTSMFLHGGWMHVIGNMLYLWIFGDNVEDRIGHIKYLFFYLISGLAAAFTHVYTNPSSRVPVVGASGAVAGVMGAYFVLYPTSRILTLVPILFFLQFIEIPAILFLGFWFVIQFFNGAFSLGAGGGGVAWWAHIGGFAGGALVALLTRRWGRHRYYDYLRGDDPWRR